MFGAFKDQEDDIAHYFEVAPQLPPAGSLTRLDAPHLMWRRLGKDSAITGGIRSLLVELVPRPTFAAVISLLNEARLNNGKPALGYLNPWLYGNPDYLDGHCERQ